MKHLVKIAGLCLASILVTAMAVTATASAAPVWETCKEGAAGTKYTEEQCVTASGTGKWAWGEVTGTEPATSLGTLTLIDTKTPVGVVEVGCTGEGRGSVGPGKFSRVEEITNISCSNKKNCEVLVKPAKPLNLPWQGELEETEKTVRNYIRATNGKGAGWSVTCKTGIFELTDECTTEKGRTAVSRNFTFGPNNFRELLVLLNFSPLAKTEDATCTIGGKESGEVLGSISLLTRRASGAGPGLRVRGL